MSTDETSDLADRLRALPPDLPQPVDRVALVAERAHRRQVRRRALAVGAVAAVAAVAVAVPAVVQRDGTASDPAPVATDPATSSTTSPDTPTEPPVDFLEHGPTLPGGTVIEPLSEPITSVHDGAAVVDLGPRPEGATAVEKILECLTPGVLNEPGGASTSCSASDMPRPAKYRSGWSTDTLKPGQHELRFPSATMRWRIVTRYVHTRVLPLGVNAKGDTYGVEGRAGRPDLVAVVNRDGQEGYVYATDLEAADPMPRTPAEAAALDPDRGPFLVPMYESDGETKVGEWEFG